LEYTGCSDHKPVPKEVATSFRLLTEDKQGKLEDNNNNNNNEFYL